MGIYRPDQIRWNRDVISIQLGTFKPMDKHYVCLHGCLILCQVLSVPPTLKVKIVHKLVLQKTHSLNSPYDEPFFGRVRPRL